jgi:membrane-associated phospholipid phosphatase
MSSKPVRGLRLIALTALLYAPGARSVLAQQQEAAGFQLRWWHAALALGAYGAFTTLDDEIQSFVRENRTESGNQAASLFKRMGQPEVFASVGLGVLVTGMIAGNDRIRQAGARIFTSLALAGGMVTVAKFVVGRSRPSVAHDADDFAPFSGNSSAPSGHTAMAFALAASLSDEIHNTWAGLALYTAAAGTAWSRVNDNAHWASDVIAGAAVGIVSAKFINGRIRLFGMRSPLIRPTTEGIALGWSGDF